MVGGVVHGRDLGHNLKDFFLGPIGKEQSLHAQSLA